jgi:hypothetical protein
MKNTDKRTIVIVSGIGILFLCCVCIFVFSIGAAILGFRNYQSQVSIPAQPARPEVLVEPPPALSEPSPFPSLTPIPVLPSPGADTLPETISTDTLTALENTIVPVSDLRELARRLQGKDNLPLTLEPPAEPFEVGDRKTFWVTNVDTNHNFQVETTLRFITEHLYFWIEDGVRYSEDELARLAETFEAEIYPINRAFFGSEWTPGVDGDPHLYVVLATELGNSVAGYYSSSDQYVPEAHPYSNGHEMFLLNADNLSLDDSFTYGVLAHEFQHMIHWYQDRNEETWLNEGFAELAAFLNGFGGEGTDTLYVLDPDIQLTTWPDSSDTLPHYGGSFLFVNYFLNRFGDGATQAVVGHEANGLHSIDAVLEELEIFDPQTNKPLRADDVFADWAVANYLLEPNVADGRYFYRNYPLAPSVDPTATVDRCPTNPSGTSVHQYGVDYIQITCEGEYVLRFEGDGQVGLLPVDPYSGEYTFWSNLGDESNMTLTRVFDFSSTAGTLTFNYRTWYDLEEDYDYLYLLASTDSGESWEILKTPGGTDENPSGNSYGWAYNGTSGLIPSWVEESVDLSAYAGKEVWLRFEYVTDAAINGQGFLLDDVSIPEIGYFSDFEADEGGWEAAGFVRVQNVLPQTFQVSLIMRGAQTNVQTYSLAGGTMFEIPFTVGGEVDEVVLVVSGTTRYTRQPAIYRYSIVSQP